MANRKFVRSLTLTTPTFATQYVLKLMYEFWGYVINGSASPTAPAAGAFPASNPNNYPANALEGTSVLATGTNGSTVNGSSTFTSAGASFNSGMIGSVLTAWVPGSGSTDDGLYLITGVPSATQLTVQVYNGGHPDPTTLQPVFNTRGSILYRVVNYSNLNSLVWANTDYIIFQMTPASSDNPNVSQATSQIQILMNGTAGQNGCNMIGSPAGTWTGAAFTDAMAGVTQPGNSQGFGQFSQTNYTMTGDLDGMFVWFKGLGATGVNNIYFEAPTRVGTYPTTTSDQNPLALQTHGFDGFGTGTEGQSFNSFYMAGSDGISRYHNQQVKSVTGDGNAVGSNYNGVISVQGMNDVRLAYAFDRGSTFISQIMLSHLNTVANFTRCRAILKQAFSTNAVVPSLHRLGSNGQYLHIEQGICMVWDNTIMPVSLLPFGG